MLSPQRFTDQALLKSEFAQRQREMASSLDNNNSPLVFSALMTSSKTVPRWLGFREFTKFFNTVRNMNLANTRVFECLLPDQLQ